MNKSRLRRLAVLDTNRMCARYKKECKELGSHMETEEERKERLKRYEAQRKHRETYQLHKFTKI